MKTLLTFATMLFFMTTVAQIPFEDTQTNLTPMYGGSFETGDVNGDGYIDYLQTGSIAHPVGEDPIPRTILSFGDGAGNVTENTTHNFPDAMSGGGLFIDVDNDEDLDAYIFGRKQNGQAVAEIHLNDGNGNFTFHQSLTGLFFANAAFGDLDNDGDLDLITKGTPDNSGQRLTLTYQNTNGNYVELPTNLDNANYGDLVIFDYDNDGQADVLLTGDNSTDIIAKLYKNIGNFNFQEISTTIVGVWTSSISIKDINNDGYLDIGINGQKSGQVYTNIYINNEGTLSLNQELTGTYNGDFIFKDVNNDSFVDTFIIGRTVAGNKIAKLYLNDGTGNMVFNKSFTPGLVSSSAIIVDMDNDSQMDIIYQGNESDSPFISPVIKVFRNTTLGTEDFTSDKVSVYPNPTRGMVNIELPSDVFVTNYIVTDMSGKQLNVSNDGTQIDLSGLQAGIYLLTINSENNGRVTKRIIKQ